MAILALGTAFCTALGAIILAEVAIRAGGAMAVSRLRTLSAAVMLIGLTSLIGGWGTVKLSHLLPIAISSFSSIIIAEPALNKSYVNIGARKTALLFALTAPIAAILGWLVLGETLTPQQLCGCALVVVGIVLAVLFSPRNALPSKTRGQATLHLEQGHQWSDYCWGLLAAIGQAAGTLAIRPVMQDAASPVAVMAVRALLAAPVLWGLLLLQTRGRLRRKSLPPIPVLSIIVLGSAISFVLGMSLMMAALAGTGVAIASTLAATTPVVILPMLWLRTGRCPAWQAWSGAIVTVAGIMLIFSN